jgi:predicted nucleic acid-binding protein
VSDSFNSQSKSIGELLGPNLRAKLEVPPFQRGFSWEKKHVETFRKDVSVFRAESSVAGGPDKYFLGPIVVLHKSKEAIELLDGQQRLATSTILLCAIRDICRNLKIQAASDFARDIQTQFIIKPEDAGHALVMGDMDRLYFSETVQEDPPKPKKPTIRSHRNIQSAQTILKNSVNGLIAGSDPSAALATLKKLVQTLRSDFVVASIPVESERDAFRIFETLNDRGLRLSVPDLLLNFLMRVANDEDRKQVRAFWSEMLEQMGRRDINRFMRHMWVSKYGDLKNTDLFTALKDHIEKKNINSLEFTRDCATECESYVQVIDADEARVGKAAPVVRSLVKTLDFQPAMPLLLSSVTHLSEAAFERVVRWLLVFIVRYSIVMNLDPSGMESVLYKLAREVRAKAGDPPACLAHVKQTLIDNSPTDDQIALAVEQLTLSPDEALYLLGRLASRMQTDTKEVSLAESNLEHIYPKNPAADEWGGDAGQEALDPYLWHIGNLTMLGHRLNRDAGNKDDTWDKEAIEVRAKKLAPLVIEVWDFDNPSRV